MSLKQGHKNGELRNWKLCKAKFRLKREKAEKHKGCGSREINNGLFLHQFQGLHKKIIA